MLWDLQLRDESELKPSLEVRRLARDATRAVCASPVVGLVLALAGGLVLSLVHRASPGAFEALPLPPSWPRYASRAVGLVVALSTRNALTFVCTHGLLAARAGSRAPSLAKFLGHTLLSFFAVNALMIVLCAAGFWLLILPGFFVWCVLALAPAAHAAHGRRPLAAIRASFDVSRTRRIPIFLVIALSQTIPLLGGWTARHVLRATFSDERSRLLAHGLEVCFEASSALVYGGLMAAVFVQLALDEQAERSTSDVAVFS